MVNLEHVIALHHLTLANAQKAHAAIQEYGSVEAAVCALNLNKTNLWEKDLQSVEQNRISLISFYDDHYPPALKMLSDPPLLLYVKGSLQHMSNPLAIVGTRVCSAYGLEIAEKWGSELTQSGCTIVSGMARGIDTAAHKGALKNGSTLAVLGSGFNHIYPKENSTLAERISQQGALITEYPMHYHPEKHFFPKRNRIVCALSKLVLLIEAPLKSGAMITMTLAEEQHKICCAIPGPIDRDGFQGNHFLIKSQKAHLVENSGDVLSLLQPGLTTVKNPLKKLNSFLLDPEEEQLLKQLPQGEIFLEEIALRVNLPVAKLNSLLMKLVLKQVIKEYPGKFYKKVYN